MTVHQLPKKQSYLGVGQSRIGEVKSVVFLRNMIDQSLFLLSLAKSIIDQMTITELLVGQLT